MDGRQPFYHRNCDVDEISYQIAGERTLMTELGVIEHRAGRVLRIPRGVAHDNYGREESHLLFYIPAPVTELAPAQRESEAVFPPFPGWQPGAANEAITQCMGALGHDITVFGVDEQLLLDQVHQRGPADAGAARPIPVRTSLGCTPPTASASAWSPPVPGGERRYRRTLDADEIQYQAHGHRTLITQRGVVDLEPGDFVRIPLGISHTSVVTEPGDYVSLLSHQRTAPGRRDHADGRRLLARTTPEPHRGGPLMATMLALRAHRGAEALVLDEIPVPEPGPLDVVVKVASAGLAPGIMRLLQMGALKHLPTTLGHEAAGVIAAVGSDVTGPRGRRPSAGAPPPELPSRATTAVPTGT